MKKKKILLGIIVLFLGCLCHIQAQTTLSGDHVITGNLNVGTSGLNKDLTVTGKVDIGSPDFPGGLTVSGSSMRLMSLTNYYGRADVLMGVADYSSDDGTAPKGSIGFGSGKFKVKYGNLSDEWGTVLFSKKDDSVSIAGGQVADSRYGATAIGYLSRAEGGDTVAMSGGFTDILAEGSVAMSGAFVYGLYATGMSGGGTGANGATGMSGGWADGVNSVAMSKGNAWQDATNSVAMSESITYGVNSVAAGKNAIARSYNSFVIGRNNHISGVESFNQWVETDPLFVVGNGTGSQSDSPEVASRNAFTIFKNGDVKIQKRQGDIVMGEFGTPGSGD